MNADADPRGGDIDRLLAGTRPDARREDPDVHREDAPREYLLRFAIDRFLVDVDAYAARLGKTRGDLLPPPHVSYMTGIAAERAQALLDGVPLTDEEPAQAKEREGFRLALLLPRLTFLRATRLNPATQKPYKDADIAARTGITRQTVWNIFNGERKPRHDMVGTLETFFHAPLGFCFRSEGEALTEHLRRMVNEDLPKLATKVALKRLGADSLALRSNGEVDVLRDILPALDTLALQERARRATPETRDE
ncbi:helix-turn-helix transcriptional regulator [Streptomyces sp. NPDC088360]|uniref:helix-turn-helix transcriptional regulator n=1 Tax=Streptomyces sp. NPDC088360 TaxID=3154515 RepID=UPI00344C237C